MHARSRVLASQNQIAHELALVARQQAVEEAGRRVATEMSCPPDLRQRGRNFDPCGSTTRARFRRTMHVRMASPSAAAGPAAPALPLAGILAR